MKINGLIKKAKWESIPCTCNKGFVMEEHPMKECSFCRYEICWKSVPQKDFKVNDDQYDLNKKLIKKQTKTVKEITLVRGSLEDVVGWTW